MSGFDPAWLDLREPADHRSRNEELARVLARHLGRRASITVLDLGCGTGSNLRATAPLLGAEQHWTLVDHDQALLEAAVARLCALGHGAERNGSRLLLSKDGKRITVRFRRADLARDLEQVARAGRRSLHRLGAVRSRLRRLHRHPRGGDRAAQGVLLHGAHLQRPAALDAQARGRRSALAVGIPRAPGARQGLRRRRRGRSRRRCSRAAFDEAGYTVSEGDSGWRLEAGDEALIASLGGGFAAAVRETELVPRPRRRSGSRSSRTGALVGHTDTLAIPP